MDLSARFDEYVENRAAHRSMTFIGRYGRVDWTGDELRSVVDRTTEALVAEGVGPGARVIVEAASLPSFVAAFWAVVRRGGAVIPSPPSTAGFESRWVAQATAIRTGGAGEFLVHGDGAPPRVERLPRTAECSDLPMDAAVVQYSSGSSRDPVGHVLSDAAVCWNAEACVETAHPNGVDDVMGSWLPLFHDMGLMSNVIMPVVGQARVVAFEVDEFARRPLGWLQTAADEQLTTTATAPFACEMLARRLAARSELPDLRALRSVVVGGDMVRPDLFAAFDRALQRAGAGSSVLHHAWGMAENTLVCSAHHCGGFVRQIRGIETLSAGEPVAGVTVRVAGSRAGSADANVGTLELRSPSLFSGTVEGGRFVPREGDWYRTGDLGCIVDGHVFVLGRSDDVVVWRGQNIYPNELEAAAASAADVVAATVTLVDARSIDRGYVLVVEGRRGASGAVDAVRTSVMDACGVHLHDVVMARRGALPRTSSGKVRRGTVRHMVLTGAL